MGSTIAAMEMAEIVDLPIENGDMVDVSDVSIIQWQIFRIQ